LQALTAVILVPVGIYALWIYSEQLKEMRNATSAAAKAADAAVQSVRLAKETASLDQRAWVAPVEFSMVSEPSAGHPIKTKVVIKNTGKTFAKSCFVKVFCEGHPQDEPERNPCEMIGDRDANGNGSMLTLAPNAEYIVYVESEILEETHVANLKDGKMTFYIYGRITYNDVFNCDHWTDFAVSLNYNNRNFEALSQCNYADNNRCF
jgi:hypothetical protein